MTLEEHAAPAPSHLAPPAPMQFVLSGPAFKANPYPTYAELREQTPVYCRASADGRARMWFVTRYADALAVLRDDERFVKDVRQVLTAEELAAQAAEPALYRLLTQHMLNADGAQHARLRGLVNRAFTARMVEQLAPRLQVLADLLIDRVVGRRQMDLIEQFALPFAVDVIGEMLGVQERDHTRLRAWSRVLVSPSASGERNAAKTARLQSVMQDFVDYLHALCEQRRRTPQDDLVSALLAARGTGAAVDEAERQEDRLTQEELYSMVLLIIVVGHETSVHMIGNGVRNLLIRRDLWLRLCADHSLIPQAVEELIRFDGPVERAPIRFAACDIEWDGQTIRRGDAVSVVLASAHRDGHAYAQPDEIDLERTDVRHLGFGQGVHYCLGAPLARLQGRIALETLTRRLPGMALAVPVDELRWHSNPILHGVKRLPVRW